jgi:hypothetical protein
LRQFFRPRLAGIFLLLCLLFGSTACARQRAPVSGPPRSIFDPRLEQLRKASVTWDVRRGPDRQVVDLVCLVPDVPTFFEAVKTWDRGHYFPILLDDVELNLRFLRAFRPSKVVRFPRKAKPISNPALMDAAIDAVGQSWRETGTKTGLPGDRVPKLNPPGAPGIVVTNRQSPSLAAAVALAAGRFEPIVEWSWEETHDVVLDQAGAAAAADSLNLLILKTIPEYHGLGDSGDFITLAGDWPYRYTSPKIAKNGPNSLDDLLGRNPTDFSRSAFTGRLIGRPAQCVYQAMCSLFLSAKSATFFDTYDAKSPVWAPYSMSNVRPGLSKSLAMKVWPASDGPGPAIWHGAFDPINQAGLVMVNTHGSPVEFFLPTDRGKTADIPFSVPTTVHFLHSFSAQQPYNPETIAARWLANGAYAYFGSMHEPYLTSFREPELIADLLTFNLPLVAAFRQGPTEAFGTPWRLMFFGDPLCRLKPVKTLGPRLAKWDATDTWPAYPSATHDAPPNADDQAVAWVLKLAIGSETGPRRDPRIASRLFDVLSKISRERLPTTLRPVFDALCVDSYIETNHLSALRSRLSSIPAADLNSDLRRWRDTVALVELNNAIQEQDTTRAGVIWETIARSDTSADLKLALIDRLTPLYSRRNRLVSWSERVHAAAPQFAGTSEEEAYRKALKSIESRVGTGR